MGRVGDGSSSERIEASIEEGLEAEGEPEKERAAGGGKGLGGPMRWR